jgi:hypothetical protein
MDTKGDPHLAQPLQERLEQVNLRVRPRPRRPVLVPCVVVVPLENDFPAGFDDKGVRLGHAFSFGRASEEVVGGEGVEGEQGGMDGVVFIGEKDVVGLSEGPLGTKKRR